MAAVVCKGAWWLLMVLVWGYWTFLKTFTQRLHLKLPMVICSSFLRGFGDVHAYRLSIHSISHKVHCWSRKCIFLSSEQCAPGLWAHLFLREMCLLYFIFHFFITVQTVYCFHLAKFCWTGACQRLQFLCVIMNCSQENLQMLLFCSMSCSADGWGYRKRVYSGTSTSMLIFCIVFNVSFCLIWFIFCKQFE